MNGGLTVRLAESSFANLPPVAWNEEEVAAALDEMLGAYKGRQYTAEDMKDAKADRAAVNRIEKQLAEAQKAVSGLYKKPVDEFTAKIREFREKAKQVSAAIDAQIKATEQAAKDEKLDKLGDIYRENAGGEILALIPLGRMLESSWLNASFPFSTARKELLAKIETVRNELEMLRRMCGEDFLRIEQEYLQGLSLNSAIKSYNELLGMRKSQAAAEEARRRETAIAASAPIIPQPTEEQREARAEGARRAGQNRAITEDGRLDIGSMRQAVEQPYDFRAWLAPDDVNALKEFFARRGIRYGRVPAENQ